MVTIDTCDPEELRLLKAQVLKSQDELSVLKTGNDSAMAKIEAVQADLTEASADLRALNTACLSRLERVEARMATMTATVINACEALLKASENEAQRVDDLRMNIRRIAQEVQRWEETS